eukprot:1119669-Prorocentrum_minimum.AAC.1
MMRVSVLLLGCADGCEDWRVDCEPGGSPAASFSKASIRRVDDDLVLRVQQHHRFAPHVQCQARELQRVKGLFCVVKQGGTACYHQSAACAPQAVDQQLCELAFPERHERGIHLVRLATTLAERGNHLTEGKQAAAFAPRQIHKAQLSVSAHAVSGSRHAAILFDPGSRLQVEGQHAVTTVGMSVQLMCTYDAIGE